MLIVGIMEVDFKILNSASLKDKRRVIKSMIDKTKRMFNVSVAEVEANDMINYSVFGLSCVSNSKNIVELTFDKILNFYNGNFSVEVISSRKEFL